MRIREFREIQGNKCGPMLLSPVYILHIPTKMPRSVEVLIEYIALEVSEVEICGVFIILFIVMVIPTRHPGEYRSFTSLPVWFIL